MSITLYRTSHQNCFYFKPSVLVVVLTLTTCVVIGNASAADEASRQSVQQNIDSGSDVATLGAITVTGEKTERSLKDTTSSVTVIDEKKLSSTQNQTIREIISEAPNLVTLTGVVPNMRGVSGNGASGGFNSISGGAKPRVSMLIDGITEPFVADFTGDMGMWDDEQIEVYRGPQSTNNGRNSIGGAVYIKTRDPSFDWQGAARLGYRGQEDYIDASLMLSGPVVEDTLAFRLIAQLMDVQTITNDEEFDTNPADFDLNEIKANRLRAKLLWVPGDDLQALLTLSSNNEQGDTGRVYYSGDDPWAFRRIYFRDIETDSDTTSLKLGYQLNETSSIDVLVANMDYSWAFDSYEADVTREQQLEFDENNKTLDARISLGEGNEQINGFVGLAYFEREQDVTSTGAFVYNGDDSSDSKALYGEMNYALSNTLNLIIGARIEKESQVRDFTYAPISARLDESETIKLPKLALQYDVTPDTRVSFSWREGYNSPGGALNFTAQEYYYYDEEKVKTFEVSVYSDLAEGKINLRGNIFHNEYQGYQALSSSRFIVNMDETTTYGAELEISAAMSSQLDLSAGLGLLKTKIDDAGDDYAMATGNELNSAPSYTASLGASYTFSQAWRMGMTYQYIDDYYGDIENSDERKAGGYGVVKLNANYEHGHWQVSAFVNNASDKKAFRDQVPADARYPDGYVDIVEPRNIGVSTTYTF